MNTNSLTPMKTDRPGWCGPCTNKLGQRVSILQGQPRYFHKFQKYVMCGACAEEYEENQPSKPKSVSQGLPSVSNSTNEMRELKEQIQRLEILLCALVAERYDAIPLDAVKAIGKQVNSLFKGGN